MCISVPSRNHPQPWLKMAMIDINRWLDRLVCLTVHVPDFRAIVVSAIRAYLELFRRLQVGQENEWNIVVRIGQETLSETHSNLRQNSLFSFYIPGLIFVPVFVYPLWTFDGNQVHVYGLIHNWAGFSLAATWCHPLGPSSTLPVQARIRMVVTAPHTAARKQPQ